MFITITIKAEAESRGELIDQFGGQVRKLKEYVEGLHKEGIFGPPEKAELRFLIIGGKWRPSEEEKSDQNPPSING